MKIINGIRTLPKPLQASIITIGNFDGVHVGHQTLIHQVVNEARTRGIASVVMTFEPHPMKVLYPDRHLHRIFDFIDQQEQLAQMGIDNLVVEPFSREFSQLPPERFLLEWVYRPFSPEKLIVGYDFSFGANRQGSIDFLRSHAAQLGFGIEVVPPVKVEGAVVSSTRIRQVVEAGDVGLASRLLGRDFYLHGIVERGAGRGRTIGIPTANLRGGFETIPARGVYCGWALVQGQRRPTVINVGLNPTFNESAMQTISIEAHIMDFDADVYGDNLRLDFVERIRDERKFAGPNELVEQIRKDIEVGRRILNAHH